MLKRSCDQGALKKEDRHQGSCQETRPSPSPSIVPFELPSLAQTKGLLRERVIGSGLQVLSAMLEEDRVQLCGERYFPRPCPRSPRARSRRCEPILRKSGAPVAREWVDPQRRSPQSLGFPSAAAGFMWSGRQDSNLRPLGPEFANCYLIYWHPLPTKRIVSGVFLPRSQPLADDRNKSSLVCCILAAGLFAIFCDIPVEKPDSRRWTCGVGVLIAPREGARRGVDPAGWGRQRPSWLARVSQAT